MKTVIIESEMKNIQTVGEDGKPTTAQEIRPAIPFGEFPAGQRSAGPDKDGNLVWTVIVED